MGAASRALVVDHQHGDLRCRCCHGTDVSSVYNPAAPFIGPCLLVCWGCRAISHLFDGIEIPVAGHTTDEWNLTMRGIDGPLWMTAPANAHSIKSDLPPAAQAERR
jgi:hypothetical protein